MKEKYHNVGTVPQSYREIVEGGQTDTTNTHIHDLSRYWLQSYIKLANNSKWCWVCKVDVNLIISSIYYDLPSLSHYCCSSYINIEFLNVDTSLFGTNKSDFIWGSLISGIHHGPVVTGFVGLNQNYVDIWGTTIVGQRGQIIVNRAYD
jgi:hypothetical protein